jgi:hypothetical protein
MAVIKEAVLHNTSRGRYIEFFADVKIKFDPHEVGSLWQLKLQMYEDDYFSDDRLGGSVTQNFRASSETTKRIGKRLSKNTVDTEWGDEEVYGSVSVLPLEPPPPFRSDSAQTNMQVINE